MSEVKQPRKYIMGIRRDDLIKAIAAWMEVGEPTEADGTPYVDDMEEQLRYRAETKAMP